jgi:hypothetical protein
MLSGVLEYWGTVKACKLFGFNDIYWSPLHDEMTAL